MFFFRKLFGLFFVGLLIFGLFGAFGRGGSSRYETAYRQGFVDGQRAAVGDSSAAEAGKTAVPDGAQDVNVYYHNDGFSFPGFSFLLCLVPLFALGLMAMGAGRHRRHGRGWSGPCGGYAPWKNGWDQEGRSSSEKSPDDIDDGPPER
jgi:hypothetical protein